MNRLHKWLRGHWPEWQKVDYDFLTYRVVCAICEATKR